MKLVSTIWNRWKKIGHFIADVISRVVLTLVYFVVIMPIGIVFKLVSDPLMIKKKSGWTSFLQNAKTLDQVKDQF